MAASTTLLKRIFNRFGTPMEPTSVTDNVVLLGTSSDANSTWLKQERMLIDLGLPKKAYFELDEFFFKQIDYICLTHEHEDHINFSTLYYILENEPHITVLMPPRMWQTIMSDSWATKIKQQVLLNASAIMTAKAKKLPSRNPSIAEIVYIPHVTEHGPITNLAIELKTVYNSVALSPTCELICHFLYATDLSSVYPSVDRTIDGLPTPAPSDLFDVICLEANYNVQLLEEYIKKRNAQLVFEPTSDIKTIQNELVRAQSNYRHLSETESWLYASHYLKPTGVYLPMHASSTFGTLQQYTRY